jgi:hypothetical protein
MNHQSGEEGVRRHGATENHSSIGLKTTSESFGNYALTRGHGFKYLRSSKKPPAEWYDSQIKFLVSSNNAELSLTGRDITLPRERATSPVATQLRASVPVRASGYECVRWARGRSWAVPFILCQLRGF